VKEREPITRFFGVKIDSKAIFWLDLSVIRLIINKLPGPDPYIPYIKVAGYLSRWRRHFSISSRLRSRGGSASSGIKGL